MVNPKLARIGKITPESLLAVLKYAMPLMDDPCPPCTGTGVVMVAGGKYLSQAYASLSMLRSVSDLPVQIWHLGPKEVSDAHKEIFADLGAEFVDAFEVRKEHPMFNLGGWQAKSFAVAYCPFERVLMLDADCYPLMDPEIIFAMPEFTSTGCLMWPDIQKCRKNDMIFPSVGIRHEKDFQEMEVGQLLIDKKRLWPAVRLTVFLNSHSEATYKMLWGDKDVWQIAMKKLGVPFSVGDKPTWKGWGMEHTLDGEPAFHHYMELKRKGIGPADLIQLMDQFESLTLQPA